MNVLILDDEPDICETLAVVLRDSGSSVSTATTLDEAKSLISETTFNAVVLDLNLADDNAFDLLKEISFQYQRVKIVAMSGGGRIGPDLGLPMARAQGADEILLKPFTNEEFIATLLGK